LLQTDNSSSSYHRRRSHMFFATPCSYVVNNGISFFFKIADIN